MIASDAMDRGRLGPNVALTASYPTQFFAYCLDRAGDPILVFSLSCVERYPVFRRPLD